MFLSQAMTEKEPEDREDPMARVFPKVTKCTFHKFGPSGTVEVTYYLIKITFLSFAFLQFTKTSPTESTLINFVFLHFPILLLFTYGKMNIL
jgi:hypothetical protein